MAVKGRRTRSGGSITPEKGIAGDYSDVERKEFKFERYEGEEPTKGLYPAKLVDVGQHTTTDDAVYWVYQITSGKYAGWNGWVYTNNSTIKWKQEQQLVALGLMEEGGSVALTYEQILKKGGPVRIKLFMDDYDGDERAKIDRVIAASSTAALPDDEDDDEPEEEEEVKPSRARARRGKVEQEPEPEDDGDEEDEDEEEGDEDGIDLEALEEELDGMTLVQLKAKAKEFGLGVRDTKGRDKDALIELILDKAEEQEPPF